MNLKRRIDKIEITKQPAVGVKICFQNPGENLEDAKEKALKNAVATDDWLIVRWLD